MTKVSEQSVSAVAAEKPGSRASEFIGRLLQLKESDRGAMARLRRNAGFSLPESRGALGLFYRLGGAGLGRDEEIYFLVATLFALHPKLDDSKNFGQSLIRLRAKRGGVGEALDRRVTVLLDSEFEHRGGYGLRPGELGFRLRQAVRLLAGEEVGVNWDRLLHDLLRWSHDDKWVQKTWAESYFGAERQDDDTGGPDDVD